MNVLDDRQGTSIWSSAHWATLGGCLPKRSMPNHLIAQVQAMSEQKANAVAGGELSVQVLILI